MRSCESRIIFQKTTVWNNSAYLGRLYEIAKKEPVNRLFFALRAVRSALAYTDVALLAAFSLLLA